MQQLAPQHRPRPGPRRHRSPRHPIDHGRQAAGVEQRRLLEQVGEMPRGLGEIFRFRRHRGTPGSNSSGTWPLAHRTDACPEQHHRDAKGQRAPSPDMGYTRLLAATFTPTAGSRVGGEPSGASSLMASVRPARPAVERVSGRFAENPRPARSAPRRIALIRSGPGLGQLPTGVRYRNWHGIHPETVALTPTIPVPCAAVCRFLVESLPHSRRRLSQ